MELKRILGETAQFSEIIELQFRQKISFIVQSWSFLEVLLLPPILYNSSSATALAKIIVLNIFNDVFLYNFFVTLNPLCEAFLDYFIILFCHFSTAIKDPLKDLISRKTSNSFCLFVFSLDASVSRAAKE